jgi:hypothetical protein
MSEEIQFNLTVSTELTYTEIRKLEIVLMRVLGYVEQLTGNKDLRKAINVIQSMIVAIRSLQMAIRVLEVASGPIGWAYAGTTMIAAGLSGYSIYESITGV